MTPLTLQERDAATLRAYIETGEMLLATYKLDGFFAQLQLAIDSAMSTIVIFATGMPESVRAVLEQRGIQHSIVDFHDDEDRTVATWSVTLFGHELAVVSCKFHHAPQVSA